MNTLNTEYLVLAANGMFLGLSQSSGHERDALIDAATLACNTLNRLVDDQEFFNNFSTLTQRRLDDPSAFASIVSIFENFKHGFLELDKQVLNSAGVDKDLIELVGERAEALIQTIRYWNPDSLPNWEPNIDTLREDIGQLRDTSCRVERSLRQAGLQTQQIGKIGRFLRRTTVALVGSAAITLNLSTLAITFGLSTPASAVSGAVGGALIVAAVTTDL